MKEATILNTLPDETYVPIFEGIDQFSKQTTKEVWFISHNSLKCPNCEKLTRMNYVHCDYCGVHMGISTPLFNSILRNLMARNKNPR
jgi:hypothetical protein